MFRRLRQIRAAISHLSPREVRETAENPLAVGLVASSTRAYAEMEHFLAPPEISEQKRREVMQVLYRATDAGKPDAFDLVLYEQGLACPVNAFTFYVQQPDRSVQEILDERDELWLPLAHNFFAFRKPVVERVIQAISRENAFFAVATALPNFLPSLFELPWVAGEFASDTAFLTLNQIRMAFLIGAASDNKVGYAEQKGEIASIITGAFGWRTIARELAGKIPFGGGLIPKGAIAFAGTYVVGLSLERYNRIGYGLSRAERKAAYREALEQGKAIVSALLNGFKKLRSNQTGVPDVVQ
jgi:hypothetical protein